MSDAAQQRRAYGNTVVSVAKSREGIEQLLVKWGVSGISWTDNFESHQTVLRFAWKKNDSHFVARFVLQMPTDDELYELAVDRRTSSNKASEKKFRRLAAERGKREHRLLHMWLKDSMEAIEQGIITADQLFFAWIEDGQGVTLYERIEPVLGQLPSKDLPKALAAPEDD